jgi:hypothetical protein
VADFLASGQHGAMFDIWLATLILGPIVLTGVVGYFSWERLAYPKVFLAIGVIVLWGVATWIAVQLLSNMGVSGAAAPGAATNGETDHFARHLCATLLIFLAVSVVLLLGLRRLMFKRAIAPGRE